MELVIQNFDFPLFFTLKKPSLSSRGYISGVLSFTLNKGLEILRILLHVRANNNFHELHIGLSDIFLCRILWRLISIPILLSFTGFSLSVSSLLPTCGSAYLCIYSGVRELGGRHLGRYKFLHCLWYCRLEIQSHDFCWRKNFEFEKTCGSWRRIS